MMFNGFAAYEEAFRNCRLDGMPRLKGESSKCVGFLASMEDDRPAGRA